MRVQAPTRLPNNNNNSIIETCVIVSTNPSFLSPEINNYCLLRAHIVGDSPRRGGARHVTMDCAFDSRSCTHAHIPQRCYNILH